MEKKTTWNAVVVDSKYGSVSECELNLIRESFQRAGGTLEICHFTTEDEILAGCKNADALLCTGNPPITRKVLGGLPQLRFVQRFGIGVNSVDLDAATEFGIVVFHLPGFCVEELADLSLAMIMGLIRNTGYYDREIRHGRWPKCQYLLPGNIRHMTLGIYGFGGAGQCLCDIVHKGFGTRVLACDPFAKEEIVKEHGCRLVDFDTLLRESDIISIHAPLTDETYHTFDQSAFQKMKPNAMIINTARGPLICEEDLVWALENQEIRYAGLDTFEHEPISADSKLLQMDNVLLSPHSGSYGETSKQEQIKMVSKLIPQVFEESCISVKHVANKQVLSGFAEKWSLQTVG